jgi:hypothetical protein
MKLPSMRRHLVGSQGCVPMKQSRGPRTCFKYSLRLLALKPGEGGLRSQRRGPVYSLKDRMANSKPKSNDSFWTKFQKFAGPFGAVDRVRVNTSIRRRFAFSSPYESCVIHSDHLDAMVSLPRILCLPFCCVQLQHLTRRKDPE